MKTNTKRINSFSIALWLAVAVFVALTIFADGLVVVSRDVGFAGWIRDIFVYSIGYKLAYKLVASAVVGFLAYFVSTMIAYGQSVKARKRARTTQLHFTPNDSGIGRIA